MIGKFLIIVALLLPMQSGCASANGRIDSLRVSYVDTSGDTMVAVVKIGDRFTSRGHGWVSPKNRDASYETCICDANGQVEIVGFLDSTRALVRIVSNYGGYETICPNGTLFICSAAHLPRLDALYEEQEAAITDEAARIDEILSGR